MLTKTQEQILKLLLSKPEEQFSIRQIARLLGKSYSLTYNNTQKLLKKGIVKAENVPPAQIIHLSEQAPIRLLVSMEGKRTEDFLEKHSWIALYLRDVLSATENPFFIMLVFGSYAKGRETKGSDIDILIITSAKEDFKTFETAAQQYTKIKKGIIVIDAQSFLEMIKNPKALNVSNEARKYHIILYGAETYYELQNTNEKLDEKKLSVDGD